MIKLLCGVIWSISETLNIKLGKLAPYIFGGMIGSKPMRVHKWKTIEEEEKDENEFMQSGGADRW